jgi:hypothetical protein
MRYVAMRFAVRFLRHQGRSIPWRMIANQSAKIGDLRIQECRDEVLHRYVRAAKLFSPSCSGPARWFNTKAWRPSSPSCCDRRRFSPTDDLLLVAVGPYSARVNCLSASMATYAIVVRPHIRTSGRSSFAPGSRTNTVHSTRYSAPGTPCMQCRYTVRTFATRAVMGIVYRQIRHRKRGIAE